MWSRCTILVMLFSNSNESLRRVRIEYSCQPCPPLRDFGRYKVLWTLDGGEFLTGTKGDLQERGSLHFCSCLFSSSHNFSPLPWPVRWVMKKLRRCSGSLRPGFFLITSVNHVLGILWMPSSWTPNHALTHPSYYHFWSQNRGLLFWGIFIVTLANFFVWFA